MAGRIINSLILNATLLDYSTGELLELMRNVNEMYAESGLHAHKTRKDIKVVSTKRHTRFLLHEENTEMVRHFEFLAPKSNVRYRVKEIVERLAYYNI